jgi:hypothetical protein
LARAFNPGAASRQRFFRRYDELWISQHTLRTLYGGPDPSGPLGSAVSLKQGVDRQ